MAILPIMAALCSCFHQPVFDEKRWQEAVHNQNHNGLFAPHKNGDLFFNPWMPMEDHGFSHMLRWRFSQKLDYTQEEKEYLPATFNDLKKRIEAFGSDDFIVWIGHATFLIRVNGQYWLTDPVFSRRVIVPKRKTLPPLSMDDLRRLAPHINVLLSHDHYDHLDKATITALAESVKAYVPLGLGSYMHDFGVRQTTELDWWQSVNCGNGIKIVCLPVQHWSRRIGHPVNSTLWASYLLITPSVTIYFGGDSGYFVGYKEIAKRYPKIDYAILPATAYHPRWFMHYAHMNVEESIQAFNDLGAKYYIPLGWGTFALGDEPPGHPALTLKKTIESDRLDSSQFKILGIGEILSLK
jgi:N-acyl-phosphatidylethanolamine-hydrolysing phospholipase D